MYVDLQRIGGDIYVNGRKLVFAVDFDPAAPTSNGSFGNVDWLLGWAKIGLLMSGHEVPYFELKKLHVFGNTQPMVGEKA